MATELDDLKTGDVVIRFGVVLRVYKIEWMPNADSDDESAKMLYFEPVYKTRSNETLRLSIPLKNLDKTTVRLPVTKSVMNDELRLLRQAEYEKQQFNQLRVKRIISDNNLHELFQVLKTLWEEKRDENKNFTISKRNTFGMVMHRVTQEVAYVLDMELEAAEEKIESALDTGWNRSVKEKSKRAGKD